MRPRISARTRYRLLGVAVAAVLGCVLPVAGASAGTGRAAAGTVPNLPEGVTVQFTSDATGVQFTINGGSAPICTVAFQIASSETQAGNGFQQSAATATAGTVIQPSDASGNKGFGVTGLNLPPGGSLVVTARTKSPYTPNAGAMIGIVLCTAQDTLYLADVAGPAAPAPPPPPPECHCTKLTLKTKPVNFTDDHTFVFDVDYTLACTGGAGGTCRAEVDVEPPQLKVGPGGVGTDWIVAASKRKLTCLGRCGPSSTGELRVVGHSKKMLERKLRAGKTFEIVLRYGCADLGQPKETTAAKTLEIQFDKRGFLDRAKSKF